MGNWAEEVEELVHHVGSRSPNTWSVGEVGSRFFVELRDYKKIFGTRCPVCKKVIVPARKICGQCFRQTDDWVEVGDQGIIQTFTVVRYPSPVQPLKASLRVRNHYARRRGYRHDSPALRVGPGDLGRRDARTSGFQRGTRRKHTGYCLFSTLGTIRLVCRFLAIFR